MWFKAKNPQKESHEKASGKPNRLLGKQMKLNLVQDQEKVLFNCFTNQTRFLIITLIAIIFVFNDELISVWID